MTNTHLKDAAKRRATRTGGSHANAVQALKRFDSPRPEQPINPPGLDWTPLYGAEVTLENEHHRLRGVVLPPDGVRPGADWLRVAVTEPCRSDALAGVTYLHTSAWRIDPMPDTVDQRFLPSTRKTRGPRGLPLYRKQELPAAALATKTMLERQHRMRPAPGQEPVAEYLHHEYSDLYAIDDAQRLPEQSAARKASWGKNRTCTRCSAHQSTPYRKADDGNRYCEPCSPFAVDEWWTSTLKQAQALATDWAQEVLRDPDSVVVSCAGWPFVRLVVLEAASGAVLHDLTTLLTRQKPDAEFMRGRWGIEEDDPIWARCTPQTELADALTGLAERRIITWGNDLRSAAGRLAEFGLLPITSEDEPVMPRLDHRPQDFAVDWYGFWLSEPDGAAYRTHLRWAGRWEDPVTLRGLRDRNRRGDASSGDYLLRQCTEEFAALKAMAAGPPLPGHLEQARRRPERTARVSVRMRRMEELLARHQ